MKKMYIKPQMKAVKINHRTNLLCGSGRGLESVSGPFNYRGSDEFYEEEGR